MKKKIIKIKSLYKNFGDKEVLKDINLDLYENESLAIIGKSGSGKSVLLKCIIGLLKPDKGSIKIYDKEMVNVSTRIKEDTLLNFGVTFQNGALFDSLTVWENITFRVTKLKKMSKEKAYTLAAEILEIVGLNDSVINQYPSELSGGMQKRVAIGRAICDNPNILLFDEPTSGLDPITGSLIDDLIKSTVVKLGVSTITITHDMSSVFKYANRVILINQNKIEWSGTPREMLKSNNLTVKNFIKNDN